ncbi:MAG: hypothetical protein GZ088_02245 [Acidipila sp.]|nr:hypothetical protein [Acidipila sp.]
MKDQKAPNRSRKAKVGSGKRKGLAGAESSGCKTSMTWTLLASVTGYSPVWVPNGMYDKAAAHFMKQTKGRYANNLLRQRMAPLGLEANCIGTCDGGWCKDRLIYDDGSSKTFVCECEYFV